MPENEKPPARLVDIYFLFNNIAKCFLLKESAKNDIMMAMKKVVIFMMIFTLILATGCVNASQDLTQNNTPSIDEIVGESTTPETPPVIIPPFDEEQEEQKKIIQ